MDPRVFTIYGLGGNLGHVTQMRQTNFRSPNPLRLNVKFGFDRPSGFWEDVWSVFPMWVYEKQVIHVFDPRAIIWTIFVKIHDKATL